MIKKYERMMKYLGDINDREVEIKKNIVYEGPKQEQCITIHSIKSPNNKVDFKLRKLSTENKSHIKYVSFKNSSKADKISGLQLNRLINVKTKYEQMEDLQVLAEAEFDGQEMIVAQIVIKAQINGVFIFNGIEQGLGANENNVYVYFKPSMTN